MIHGVKREIQKLRRKLVEDAKEFQAAAPLVDETGLPDWDGSGLTVDVYERALDGDVPDADLTDAELETRHRLSPYASVFEQLQRDEKAEVGP